jgi:MscS family membrane protein
VVGWTCTRTLQALLARAARRSAARWDDHVVAAIGRPLSVGVVLAATWAALPWLPLDEPPRRAATITIALAALTVAAWLLLRVVDAAHHVLGERAGAADRPTARSLLSIGSRMAKFVVLVVGFILALSTFGVPVTSLVAGLGIGGVALALAAQKTVENLFGTLSIGVDQPFCEGDFVRIGDVLGTVEAIGLRSTRVRTLDRTLVTIPNGQLADSRSETFTARDRIRLACTLGLVYETTAAQMRRILAELEAALRAHPKIWPDAVIVRFAQYGASSLDVEIMAWFQTTDWNEFTAIRQELLLAFMEVVERNDSGFAFPTQTVHVAGGAPPPRDDHPSSDAAIERS